MKYIAMILDSFSSRAAAQTALEDACKIEHDLSPETFDRLAEYAEKHFPEE